MSTGESDGDRFKDNWGRMAYGGVVAGLATGFLMFRVGQPAGASLVLAGTCGLLLALPVINLIVVLDEEVRRRDWGFAALALGVLALIAWTVLTKI